MPSAEVAVCVDFGSTFTKASLVDLRAGRIIARAEHPTTIETDLLDGYDACLAELVAADARAAEAEVLACSSAGGGLRIAVVGNEELVTAEAGRRVALSSGGRVVAVIAVADGVALDRLEEPDVVLLTGGTDDGNTEAIITAAGELVAAGWTGPVVVAGNVDAQGAVSGLLWGGLVRLLVLHHVTYSINSLCHFFGRKRFQTDDESRNLAWLSLITFGEAWHNNHHAFPTSAAHGLGSKLERVLDPSASVIWMLEKTGLAWDVVRISPDRLARKAVQPAQS